MDQEQNIGISVCGWVGVIVLGSLASRVTINRNIGIAVCGWVGVSVLGSLASRVTINRNIGISVCGCECIGLTSLTRNNQSQ